MDDLEPLENILQTSFLLAKATLRRNAALRAVGVRRNGTVLFRRADVERVLGRLQPPKPSGADWPAIEAPRKAEKREPPPPKVIEDEADWLSLPSADKRSSTKPPEPEGWGDLPSAKIDLPTKRLHTVADAVRASIKNSKQGDHGLRYSGSDSPLSVSVSRSLMSRALVFLDEFLRRAQKQGYELSWTPGSPLYVVVRGEKFRPELEERLRQAGLAPPERVGAKYEYVPNGTLALSFAAEAPHRQRLSWSDRRGRRLENKVDEIFAGLENAAEQIRTWRAELEQQKQRSAELRRAAEEQEKRRQEEETRRETLFRQAADWTRARDLRQFIGAVREAAKTLPSDEERQGIAGWLEWAARVADDIDPLVRR